MLKSIDQVSDTPSVTKAIKNTIMSDKGSNTDEFLHFIATWQ